MLTTRCVRSQDEEREKEERAARLAEAVAARAARQKEVEAQKEAEEDTSSQLPATGEKPDEAKGGKRKVVKRKALLPDSSDEEADGGEGGGEDADKPIPAPNQPSKEEVLADNAQTSKKKAPTKDAAADGALKPHDATTS